jgi:excisionase family DNA binding protein
MSIATDAPPVMTLEEVATYLRLPEETIVRQATQGLLPGRSIENNWRFLKTAIDNWLRAQDNRTLLLQQAGVFADDEHLVAIRRLAYAARKRPESENDE